MSSSVIIDVDTKYDVIAVETSAIKTQGNRSYVEVWNGELSSADAKLPIELDSKKIEKRIVKIGLSDDNKIEILSGLKEGDNIIVKTIAIKASSAKTSTTPSLLGGSTGGGARPTGATSNFNRAR
jgi:multidrug efflux pump subunit AcrA (membrane-fusion protein)